MKTIFELCFFVVLVGIPAQLFYWCVIRQALLAKADLEMLRIKKKIGLIGEDAPKEARHALPILTKKCDLFLQYSHAIDAVQAICTPVPVETKLRVERDREIVAEAPADIRDLNKQIEILAASTAAFNSPGLIVIFLALLPVILCLAACCMAMNKAKAAMEWVVRVLRFSLYLPCRC